MASVLAVALLAASSLRAQIVADGATNTLSNVTNTFTGDVIVGTNGSFTLLIFSDNALLTNSVNGVIGRNATAQSNEVQLLSPTARWRMGNNLYVGSNAAFSTLVVGDGAFLNNNNALLGNAASSSNNLALVTGNGSLWSNRLDLTVGVSGRDNQLIVSEGARVASRIGNLGSQPGSSNNLVVVTGIGSSWTNHSDLNVGVGERANRLVIEAGGFVGGNNGRVGAGAFGSSSEALVTGPGSLWSSRTDLAVGLNPANNRLVVSNGAAVVAGNNGRVGVSTPATGNEVLVTGVGSLWSNQVTLYVGEGGAGNWMEVNSGGRVTSSNTYVGFQSASNFVLVTGAGSLWSNRNDFVVGNLGGGNQLVIGDGGRVDSVFARLGMNASSSGNTVQLTGPGSSWKNQSAFSVGVSGSSNRLVISDGALVADSFGILGQNATGSNNEVVVTGPGSIWTNAFDCRVGDLSPGNRLVISNGGAVKNELGFIGGQPSSSSNLVVVTGSGSTWSNADDLVVGSIGAGNQLVVSNGGLVRNLVGFLGGNTPSSNNSAVITGPGSLWTMPNGALFIGQSSSVGNRLVVSNGAAVHCGIGWLGFDGTIGPNEAFVTGADSLWSNANDLTLGRLGRRSVLVISNEATVSAGGNVTLGSTTSSANNRLVVHGGTLRATNAAGNASLIVNRGTNVLSAGLIDVDRLVLTNNTGPTVPTAFGNALAISVPSGSPATTYPVPITVLGLSRGITKVTVTLSNLSHTFPDDLDILLVSPTGQKVMLMSDAGGSTDISNVRLTFDDGAGTSLPDSTAMGTGTFRPADYEAGETMPGSAPAGPYATTLSVFNGSSPNGTWQLYLADDFNPDSGSLSGWGLQITTDPDLGFFEFNGGTLITRGASISNGTTFVVGRSGTTPAVWDVRAGATDHVLAQNFYVGESSSFNQLLVTNGAPLLSDRDGYVGVFTGANSNSALITGNGSHWSGRGVTVGFESAFNQLIISNGAVVFAGVNGGVIGGNIGGRTNLAVVTGSGSVWSNANDLIVGGSDSGNELLVSDGGTVVSGTGFIGFNAGASNSTALITGAGSTWSNAGPLIVGRQGARSQLIVSNGAALFSAGSLQVGTNATSTNNRVVVDGGTLRTTNASVTGLIEIRRGTNVLNSGLIEADILRMTNGLSSKFEFNGGTLSARSSRVSIGPPLLVGDGVNSATFELAGNGTHDFSGTLGLIVRSNATLTGNGSLIVQLQVQAGAELMPGASVGRISLSTPPFLSGTVLMELSKNGAVLTNDELQVTGTLTYGGALVVTDLGPTPLAAGDRFQLFSATAYAGSFTEMILPTLGPGLRWVTNLLVDGSIEVFAAPPVGAGFALNFDGTNDFVQVSADSRFNAYPLVATAWINTTQAVGEVGIINKYVAGSFNGWQVGLLNGEARAWYARDNANQVGNPGSGVNGGFVANGEWHHVAFTVDATGGSLYVDGFFKEKLGWFGTPGACTTTQELSFARYPGGPGEFFQCTVDEAAIWRGVEQTADDIKTNLNRGLLGSESGLVLYQRMNDGTGSPISANAAEATGGFANGLLQNGVTWVPGLVLRPAILTKNPNAVTANSATLRGETNPGLTNTAAWFEWGATTNYGNVTPVQLLGSGGNNTNFSQSITGLTENATYHFRAVASNSIGASFGADKSFFATGTNMINARVAATATLLPNGKVLVAGGRDQDFQPLAAAELYDPATGTWTATGPMTTARYDHTATLLPNGKVLATGGQGDQPVHHASAELYDPATGTWTSTGSMGSIRHSHTATLLPGGTVMVTGGIGPAGFPTAVHLASTELYNPTTGTWTSSGSMSTGRYLHTATLLASGKVLIAGGSSNFVNLANAELYDPVSGMWTNTGAMTTSRKQHTATLLRTGKVLVVGGSNTNFLNSAELYDPAAGTWTATGSMLNYRFAHTATLLPNGRVFAAGEGIGAPSIYNPASGTWTDVPGPDPGTSATATLLANGKVLVAGGVRSEPVASAALFDYAVGSWAVAAPMANARDGHTATLLPNGRVLVASFANSEIFNPVAAVWSNAAALDTPRYNHTAILLPSGRVLAAGGQGNLGGFTNSSELYDPASGLWTNTGFLATNRAYHRATLLLNGQVLVTGGASDFFSTPLRTAELFDPVTGSWTNTGMLTTNRTGHSATLLPNGLVLVAGGVYTGGFFPSVTPTAELYDPDTGLWTAIPPMATNRSAHIAVLLPNGKVLVAGGSYASLLAENASAELFDPATGTWKPTGSMTVGRSSATATLLPNGKVLVAAGYNGNAGGYLSSAELYDPQTGQWTATASLGAAHTAHTSTLLPNGLVLVTGGNFGSGITDRVELYDVGLGFSNSWRPQITAIGSPVNLGGNLAVTGALFRGLAEGSGGNSSQDSPSDHPVVQLRNLESQATAFLLASSWSTNTFASLPISGLPPGWAMATVFVNGIPSQSSLLSLLKPAALVTMSNLFQYFDGTARSVSVATVPPGLMVSVTYDGSPNAPTNIGSYTVIATILDLDYESSPVTNTLVVAPVRDFGMDVSHFQNESGVPQASWDLMFAEGKRFVFIKATEGLTGPHDPTMAINVQRASAAGLLVGVYHFAHPENRPTTNGAILEASNMVVYAGSAIGPGRLRPVIDIEGNATSLSTEALTDWVIAFSDEIIARRGAGAAPIIYCSQNSANNEFDSRLADYDLWLRTVGTGADPALDDPPGVGFADPTGVFDDWSFWQYSATGSSGGISPLDLNVCHSEYKPLSSFLIPNPAPAPIAVTGTPLSLGGAFQLSFTNTPGALFSVVGTTNVALPLGDWPVLGSATEISPGLYQFTDPVTTNNPQRFYGVRWP